jgi:flagellar biosynthesis/type III secretory pathway ATPase
MGEYQRGNDAVTDEALERGPQLDDLLRQPPQEPCPWRDALAALSQASGVAVAAV